MALKNTTGVVSRPAAADFSAATKPRFVVMNSSGQYALCGAGAVAHGVADNFDSTAITDVRADTLSGTQLRIELNGTLARGAKVVSDASGRAVAGTTGHIYLGILEAAGVAGDIITLTFMPGQLGTVP